MPLRYRKVGTSIYTGPMKTSLQLRVLFEHHSEIHSHQASHKTKEVNAPKVSAKCGGLITIPVRDLPSHTRFRIRTYLHA